MIKPGKYRHFKGNEYEVLDIATHSETLEPMVVYRPLYGEGKLWVRPASMWEEMVELDSKLVPRFTYLPKKYTNALSRLWYNGTEPEWEKALAHYHTLYKDVALEIFMEKLKPETVDQFVVLALLTIDDLPEHEYLGKMNPALLSLKDGVLLEEIMRQKALELNQKFQTDRWTPRKIDMVLWAYDR